MTTKMEKKLKQHRSYEVRVPADMSGDELLRVLCASGRLVKFDKEEYSDGEEGMVLTLI